jgi:putative glutamine amidotransferase
MKNFKGIIFILVFVFIIQTGCQHEKRPLIVISKAYGTVFQEWFSQVGHELDFINMYGVREDSIDYYLSESSGIVLSGGPDVNPALYGREDEIEKCEDIDYWRDTLEIRMIRYAMAEKIPLLCICRGLQILNVSNQGTLIPDIATDYDTIIRHRGKQSMHWVDIVEGSMLHKITQTVGDSVNSSHHQAVKDVASSFISVAFAEDGLVEAIELADTSVHLFILGVQWHPERMSFENSLSGPIAERFIQEVIKFHRQK